MADPELVQVLDYILNRSDEASIEVLTAALVRRKRDISMFGGLTNMPDPKRLAKELSEKINTGIGAGVDSLKKSVREMAARIIRQEAPELTDRQINELLGSWIPDTENTEQGSSSALPRDILVSMIDQFVSFSKGNMKDSEDNHLRAEMGAWPERYWKAFPPLVRSIITEFLKGKISEKEFNLKIGRALDN